MIIKYNMKKIKSFFSHPKIEKQLYIQDNFNNIYNELILDNIINKDFNENDKQWKCLSKDEVFSAKSKIDIIIVECERSIKEEKIRRECSLEPTNNDKISSCSGRLCNHEIELFNIYKSLFLCENPKCSQINSKIKLQEKYKICKNCGKICCIE